MSDAQCPWGTLCPPAGTFLVPQEPTKHTANSLPSLNRLWWVDPSRPLPSQSPSNGSFGKTKGPGFIAERDVTWHGVPLWCCVPSRPLAHPHSLLARGHAERNRGSLGALQAPFRTSANAGVFSTLSSYKGKTQRQVGGGVSPCPPPPGSSVCDVTAMTSHRAGPGLCEVKAWPLCEVKAGQPHGTVGHDLPPGRSLPCPGGCVPVAGVLLPAIGFWLSPEWPPLGRQHSCGRRRTHRLAGELHFSPR